MAEARGEQATKALGLFATEGLMYFQDAMVPGESRTRLYGDLIKQLEEQAKKASGEATIDALRNKVYIYQTLCQVTLDFSDYAKSKECFEKGMENLDLWEKDEPGNPLALGYRATFLNLRGNALKAAGKLESANKLFGESLDIRRKLVDDPKVDPVDALAKVADSLDGLEQFEDSIKLRVKICKTLAQEERKAKGNEYTKAKERSYPYRTALCLTYEKAAYHAADYATRKEYLTKAAVTSEELHTERESNRNILLHQALVTKMLGELEYSYGILAEKAGKDEDAKVFFAAATGHYDKLNKISVKLATSKELLDGVREYARSYYTLALAKKREGKPREARELFEISRTIREQIFHDYRGSSNSGHLELDLWFSQLALGDLGMMDEAQNKYVIVAGLGEPDLAYRLACIFALASTTIEESRNGEPLTEKEKQTQRRYRSEAFRYLQIAHDQGFTDFFQSNIDADLDAIRAEPRMKEFEVTHHYQLGVLQKRRGQIGAEQARRHFQDAKTLAEQGMKALKGDARFVHVKLAWLCTRVQLGQHAEAIEEADAMRPKVGWLDGPAQFRLARVYALASGEVKDPKLQEECCAKALAALQKAGPSIAKEARLVAEDDLAPIRGDPRFRKLLESAKRPIN